MSFIKRVRLFEMLRIVFLHQLICRYRSQLTNVTFMGIYICKQTLPILTKLDADQFVKNFSPFVQSRCRMITSSPCVMAGMRYFPAGMHFVFIKLSILIYAVSLTFILSVRSAFFKQLSLINQMVFDKQSSWWQAWGYL